MNSEMTKIFFALVRSAIRGKKLSGNERELLSELDISCLVKLADKHEIAPIIVSALKENGVDTTSFDKLVFKAIYVYDRMNLEMTRLTEAFEEGEIPFIPLKGAVIRSLYPKPFMRTSCDIDVFVRESDLDKALSLLSEKCGYQIGTRGPHDVQVVASNGTHIELHFKLVEEARVGEAFEVLTRVFENAEVCDGFRYKYAMSDPFFYFYHVAHMAKHFETGGCGIRPFIDLWILDSIEEADKEGRDKLLEEGRLLKFAERARALSKVWLEEYEADDFSLQLEKFILNGGVFGSAENRVSLNQKKKGGRFGYFMSRVFASKDKLSGYYPILKKHPWLLPFMQVRRWFLIFRPNVARMAKGEMRANKNVGQDMNEFFEKIGL